MKVAILRIKYALLFISIFTSLLTLTPIVFAMTNEALSKDSSIYKYNTLENKLSNLNHIVDPAESTSSQVTVDSFMVESNNIAKKQNLSQEQVKEAIDRIESSSKLRTFLVENKLGTLRFQLVQVEDQVHSLRILVVEEIGIENKILIDKQIQVAKEEQKKIEDFLTGHDKQFSLFGWFVGLL
jgi:hypothetical protein